MGRSASILINVLGRAFAPRNEARHFEKCMESLLGICRGLLADQKLNAQEVLYLGAWLDNHPEVTEAWPGEVIAQRIRRAMADGYVSEAELADLQELLRKVIGGTLEETGAPEGGPTTLPFDWIDSLEVVGRRFCFTGQFLCGTREFCEESMVSRGAIVSKGVTKKLDYLVVGAVASADWVYSSYGRKIEKAIEYRSDGCPVRIIPEARWQDLLPPT